MKPEADNKNGRIQTVVAQPAGPALDVAPIPFPAEPLSGIETWVFDLDNTLYPAGSNLFAQISTRMGEFIMRLLDLDADAARVVQKRLFTTYGTTMRGLMTEHAIDPHAFMAHVHDIDLSVIDPAPALDAALSRIAADGGGVFPHEPSRHDGRIGSLAVARNHAADCQRSQ